MRRTLIATAGHVDHGKTTLISALTGIDAGRIDRLPDEKRRGITIDLGYAYLKLPGGGTASIIDVPGHEKFIKNMLAGAGNVDLVLMVIAADDGVMPQTREHLGILNLLGAKQGIVVLTKCDTVHDPEWLTMLHDDIRETVKNTFLSNADVIEVSAHTGQGMDTLREKIFELTEREALASRLSASPLHPFRLPIDRVFTADGYGTVVTGTLIEGTLRTGDTVTIYPAGHTAKVRTLQVHGGEVSEAFAGQRAAVNLSGLKREMLTRGDVLAAADSMRPARILDVRLTLLPDAARAVKSGARLHFHYGTQCVLCKAVLMEKTVLQAGKSAFAQLRFAEEVAVKESDRFVVRFYSPVETVGGGVVLDISAKKVRAGRAAQAEARLKVREEISQHGTPADRVWQAIADGGAEFLPLDEISKRVPPAEREKFRSNVRPFYESGKIILFGGTPPTHGITAEFYAVIMARVEKILTAFHADNPLQPGIRKEELRSRALPAVKPAHFDELLQMNAAFVTLDANRAALSTFRVSYTLMQEKIRDDIISRLIGGLFSPPAPEELIAPHAKKAADFHAVLDALQTGGTLVTTEQGIIFHTQAIEAAKKIFRELTEQRSASVTLAIFRDTLATSRKYALSLLEYFDRTRFTRKDGDGRILN